MRPNQLHETEVLHTYRLDECEDLDEKLLPLEVLDVLREKDPDEDKDVVTEEELRARIKEHIDENGEDKEEIDLNENELGTMDDPFLSGWTPGYLVKEETLRAVKPREVAYVVIRDETRAHGLHWSAENLQISERISSRRHANLNALMHLIGIAETYWEGDSPHYGDTANLNGPIRRDVWNWPMYDRNDNEYWYCWKTNTNGCLILWWDQDVGDLNIQIKVERWIRF